MPQIANQDYIVIAPKEGRAFSADAAALGRLKKCVLNGTAFDCLIRDYVANEHTIDRVLGFYDDDNAKDVLVSNVCDSGVGALEIPEYTPEQFAGLAAVQNAIDEADGELMMDFPGLSHYDGNILSESISGYEIGCNGKQLIATIEDGFLKSLEISSVDIAEGEGVDITWEDAQKLIGLLIG